MSSTDYATLSHAMDWLKTNALLATTSRYAQAMGACTRSWRNNDILLTRGTRTRPQGGLPQFLLTGRGILILLFKHCQWKQLPSPSKAKVSQTPEPVMTG